MFTILDSEEYEDWNLPTRGMLDPDLVRLLKIPEWGHTTGEDLGRLNLKVDHQLVCSVLEMDIALTVKIDFFWWVQATTRMFAHDSTSYMALIRCLGEAKLYSEIRRTIQDVFRNPLVRFSTYELSELMKVLGRAKMVSEALSVLYHVKNYHGCNPDTSTYNSVFLMLMHAGLHDEVLEVYADMCNEPGCYPDRVTYSALISSYVMLGRHFSAIKLFDEMKDKKCLPTEKIYTTLLGIYSKVGKVKKALHLFEEMKQTPCCSPTVYTYTELVKMLGNAGMVREAYGLYKDMLRDGLTPDAAFLVNMMKYQICKVEDIMKNVSSEMVILGGTPSVVPYSDVVAGLVFRSKAPVPVVVSSWFDRMVLGKQIEWRELCCFSRRWMRKVFRVLRPPHNRSWKGDKQCPSVVIECYNPIWKL